MLSILGAGHAYPAGVLDNELLYSLNQSARTADIGGRAGIRSRSTSLPVEYIRDIGNRDLPQSLKVATDSPTSLGHKACLMAIERAGIQIQDIGLVIGDCATAWGTIPSEAQRIANRLELKVPSYDVLAYSASFAAHMEMLLSWKEDRIPRYVLCVSTNTPTQFVNYGGNGMDMMLPLNLGDAAAAVVVSPECRGRLAVQSAFYSTDASLSAKAAINSYGYAHMNAELLDTHISPAINDMLQKAFKAAAQNNPAAFVGSQCSLEVLRRVSEEASISPDRCWANVDRVGDSLGSGPAAVLSEHWDEIKPEDIIVAALAGAGFSHGYVVMKGM